MTGEPFYAFEITLHRLAPETAGLQAGGIHVDPWGSWPTLAVPHDVLNVPLATGFDDAFTRLALLDRMYGEPDGSFVWASPRAELSWQVDGNALEKAGRVLLVDLKGSCPEREFDQLLEAFGWPEQAVMMQLVRPAVFLDERVFRRHALTRGAAGDGEMLRPR